MMGLKLVNGIRRFCIRGQDNCRCGSRKINADAISLQYQGHSFLINGQSVCNIHVIHGKVVLPVWCMLKFSNINLRTTLGFQSNIPVNKTQVVIQNIAPLKSMNKTYASIFALTHLIHSKFIIHPKTSFFSIQHIWL